MSPHLEQQLLAKYPLVMTERTEFAFGDGWYTLMDEFLGKLDLVRRATGGRVYLEHSKEKLATIRTFVGTEMPTDMPESDRKLWWNVLLDIECQLCHRSASTCEETGAYGALHYKGYWLKTLSTEKAAEMGFKAQAE